MVFRLLNDCDTQKQHTHTRTHTHTQEVIWLEMCFKDRWMGLMRFRAPLVWSAKEILKFQGGAKGGNFERRDERWRIRLLNFKTAIDLECFRKYLHSLVRRDVMSW